MPDAQVSLWHRAPLHQPQDQLYHRLLTESPWREESITLYGKRHLQPRLLCWYGDPEAHYTYSGVAHAPLPWTPLLLEIKSDIEQLVQYSFNSVLLNYYRNERDSMGMHADDEPELGPEPVIASLSLGDERVLQFRHQTRRAEPTRKLPLAGGSLLLMSGATQKHWKHGIAKSRLPCGGRINLTFRAILSF